VKNLKSRRVKVVQIKEMENGFVSDSAILEGRNSVVLCVSERETAFFVCGILERESEVGE
jgi:hypothetical protein